jgi:hypothetical protein
VPQQEYSSHPLWVWLSPHFGIRVSALKIFSLHDSDLFNSLFDLSRIRKKSCDFRGWIRPFEFRFHSGTGGESEAAAFFGVIPIRAPVAIGPSVPVRFQRAKCSGMKNALHDLVSLRSHDHASDGPLTLFSPFNRSRAEFPDERISG